MKFFLDLVILYIPLEGRLDILGHIIAGPKIGLIASAISVVVHTSLPVSL